MNSEADSRDILIVDDDKAVIRSLKEILESQGYSVVRKISPRTAKIMLTGYPTYENAVESLNKGADAFLTKPINPQELLRVVNEKSHEKLIEKSKDLLV